MRHLFFSLLLLATVAPASAQITGISGSGEHFVDAKGQRVGKEYSQVFWEEEPKHGVFKADNGLWGVVNQHGKEVLPPQYEWVYCGKELIAVTQQRSPRQIMGAYNYKYQKVYDLVYEDLTEMDLGGTAVVELRKDGKRGAGNQKGQVLIPVKYDYLGFYWQEEGNTEIIVSNGGRWKNFRYLDGKTWGAYVNWKMEVPCEYDTLASAGEDHIYMVRKDGKWGYYGNGRELIAPQYDVVSAFDAGVATVRKDGEVRLVKNPLRNADDIQIASGGPAASNKKQRGPVVSRYPKPDSDVDRDIPVAKRQAETTFAFIIANENYADAPVPYSLNDGRMFREYCQKALGLPEKNISLYEDATFGTIITAVEKMKQVADAYEGEASVIFYYAGHGFPDERQQTAYLLPIDGDASSITTTGYSLARLYKDMAAMRLKAALVLLDACFSGAKREDQMLASSRGVAIKVRDEAPGSNMVVFSAAKGDETAHQMEDKHHGLFTYFLLKGMQNTQGDADLGTLTDYVTKQVKRQSVVINNKRQTPTVIPSPGLAETWRTMKLR